jgi:hypothetical protein
MMCISAHIVIHIDLWVKHHIFLFGGDHLQIRPFAAVWVALLSVRWRQSVYNIIAIC